MKQKATYKYDAETSYLDYMHAINVKANNAAFIKLLKEKAEPPKRIYEGMAGVGFHARLLKELYPDVKVHRVWDLDPRCCEELRKVPDIQVNCGNFFESRVRLLKGDLLVVDANTFTIRQWDFHRPLFQTGAGQVICPDLARGKLHLHYKTYGLNNPDWDEYMSRLAQIVESDTGMKMVGYEKCPRSLGYFLWRRT